MKFIKTEIPEVVIIEPTIFGDSRGYFVETYHQEQFEKYIGKVNFIQDNESKSSRGVLRGLHFQKPPFTQSKLVRCIEGEILDVAVDIRKNSPTYGKHISAKLSGKNKRQLFVPKGFAHGFSVLSKTATVAYKVDNIYVPNSEEGISWDDSELNIDWKLSREEVLLSEKDKNLKTLNLTDIPFKY